MEGGDSLIIKSITDTTPLIKKPQNIIFTKVEVESQYPGGQNAWNEYLSKNLKYPQDAVKRKVQGTVIVQFIIDADGSVSNIKILKKPDASLSEACYNIIKNSGKWTPAMQNGKKVRSYKKQPIVFKLEDKS